MISTRVRLAHAMTDENWNISGVDPNFCELMKMHEADLMGRHVLDITHPEDRTVNRAAMDALMLHNRPFWIDKRYLRSDGKAVAVRNHVSILNQGGRPNYVAATAPRLSNEDLRCVAVFSALDELADATR